LAELLRNSGVAFSESEYRDTFKAIYELQSDIAPVKLVKYRQTVRRILGPTRSLQFFASSDPSFPAIRSVCLEWHVQDSQMLAVYSVLLDAQDDMAMAVDTDESHRADEFQRIVARRDQRLGELLGDVTRADRIVSAQTTTLAALRASPVNDRQN
jgi:hypothetical protein